METHYLTGSNTDTCIVAEDDTMKWKNKNQCRGKCLQLLQNMKMHKTWMAYQTPKRSKSTALIHLILFIK